MLHELRFYKIAPRHIDEYVDHAGKVVLPLRGDRYWLAFLKVQGALVENIESSLMMPADFSPLQ